jgi:hypothetical protein
LPQHVRLAPLPHGVVPDGHPHVLDAASVQATPFVQHVVPHGVVPAGQQQTVFGSEHVWPFWQQPLPHAGAPAGQPTVASPRNGRSTVAAVAAAAAVTIPFNSVRREFGTAIARARSSN